MSVEEYSFKFTRLSRCAPSLVSNPMDEMSRFVTGVTKLVKEKCRTAMIHGDMNLSRLTVYAQPIEKSKLRRITRNMKRSGTAYKKQSRFEKRDQIQDYPRDPKVKFEKGSGS